MKTKIVFILACLTASSAMTHAQNLDKLPQAERDSIILEMAQSEVFELDKMPKKQCDSIVLEIAKAAVRRHAPGWYRDYKIEIMPYTFEKGPNTGRKNYTATFFYDPNKEYMHKPFSVSITILYTGKLKSISFGNPEGLQILIDMPKQMYDNRKHQVMPFHPMKRPKPYQPGDSIVES